MFTVRTSTSKHKESTEATGWAKKVAQWVFPGDDAWQKRFVE